MNCVYCNEEFRNKAALNTHLHNQHPGIVQVIFEEGIASQIRTGPNLSRLQIRASLPKVQEKVQKLENLPKTCKEKQALVSGSY